MARTTQQLSDDLQTIWQAGVTAVDSALLVEKAVQVAADTITIGSVELPLSAIGRLHVVGGGKAAAGMAVGLEHALGETVLTTKRVSGWINVPEDCLLPTSHIHLHAARGPGQNEPTQAAVDGTTEILRQVSELSPQDVCLALISGGGSALLAAPAAPLTVRDIVQVTRVLSAAGADIHQLNTVRKKLSRVKGGGLWRSCQAGHLFVLIISDVIGDPLDVIASGPTIADTSTVAEALSVLRMLVPNTNLIPSSVWQQLENAAETPSESPVANQHGCQVHHCVIGNIDVATRACAVAARARGYDVEIANTNQHEATADEVGRDIAELASAWQASGKSGCWISGGEPIVRLAPREQRGHGGRNQQLVLAAAQRLLELSQSPLGESRAWDGVALISGGTDGEDGPTDAAGAMIWPDLLRALQVGNFDLDYFLTRNDAYNFFAPWGGLLRCGPTHTNVCDVRIFVVDS